ncbi:hypothetical protein GCM10028806_34660 [Spirosoma terrae]|uniref:HAD family hydrolase n=1 Tax=Spirosoma terrae TaxID=1968276 RepID=A0A6L9L5W2_9BACT|nr:HAD domain-containing protein [Spirosoma terrae]NDU95780.1 hypothetical protein [Spirosoma terrae]
METTEPNKAYLFLDFDGVLNHELFHNEWYEKLANWPIDQPKPVKPEFCPRAIQSLNDLCEQFTHLSIVISSVWRAHGADRCLEILTSSGFSYPERVIDRTPLSRHRVRGVEVLDWLKQNTEYGTKPVDYVILDDDSDFLIWQSHRFIHVDPYSGLNHNHVYKIGRILNRLI